jgi:integrase
MPTTRAEPFWRASKGAWYFQYPDGRQVSLGKDEDAARKRWHEMMLELGRDAKGEKLLVKEAFDLFLRHSDKHHEKSTFGWYNSNLNDAAESFGNVEVGKLKVHHVSDWLDDRGVGDTTRANLIGMVQTAINFCVEQGHVPANPVKHMTRPVRARRHRDLTEEEKRLLLDATTDQNFRDLLTVLMNTGARPGEIYRVAPENVNLEDGIITLARHKTMKKREGKPRVIIMAPIVREIVERLMSGTEPGQPLFTNTRGKAWNTKAVYSRLLTLKSKHPALHGAVAYTLRHAFITGALERGLSEAVIGELCSTSPQTIHKHYNQLSQRKEFLREMAEKAVSPRTTT